MCFSAQLMVQRAAERLAATSPHDDPREYVYAIIQRLFPLDADSRAGFEVNLALFAERTAVPELVEARDDVHRQLAGLSARLVEMLVGGSGGSGGARGTGRSAANLRARQPHALIDGLAFHLVHQSPVEDHTWSLDLIRSEIEASADA